VPPVDPYKKMLSSNKLSVSQAALWQKTYLAQIFLKRRQLGITLTKLYWLLGCKSKLSKSNELLLYKTTPKPIRTSTIELQHRNHRTLPIEALRALARAEYGYPKGSQKAPTVKEEMCRYVSQYSAHLNAYSNGLTVNLIVQHDNRRFGKHPPNDLHTSFLV
jgi:hypothetical protein